MFEWKAEKCQKTSFWWAFGGNYPPATGKVARIVFFFLFSLPETLVSLPPTFCRRQVPSSSPCRRAAAPPPAPSARAAVSSSAGLSVTAASYRIRNSLPLPLLLPASHLTPLVNLAAPLPQSTTEPEPAPGALCEHGQSAATDDAPRLLLSTGAM
ncbi:hypothetical protein GUJ93_ZPchr0013g35763 [Zizania palustris]|uniref:Uncharacterized protein n=1 Tax=Zizania palustris TaxID=103762 RepID=A0A8J6BTQ1_ZIZPA|nr:hypothetical protein GUJ93_ZPchr0013g35763 [Zizania palustris]